MATTLERLAQINDKLETLDEQTGPRGQIDDILRLVQQWMVELQTRPPLTDEGVDSLLFVILDVHKAENFGSVISILQDFPALYAFLYWIDRGGALIIFQDPSHTISYNIAIRAQAGDPIAIKLCAALNLLSPDHCAWAIKNESLCRVG